MVDTNANIWRKRNQNETEQARKTRFEELTKTIVLQANTKTKLKEFEDNDDKLDDKQKLKLAVEICQKEINREGLLEYIVYCIRDLLQKNKLLIHFALLQIHYISLQNNPQFVNKFANEHKYRIWGLWGTVYDLWPKVATEKIMMSRRVVPVHDNEFQITKSVFDDLILRYTF